MPFLLQVIHMLKYLLIHGCYFAEVVLDLVQGVAARRKCPLVLVKIIRMHEKNFFGEGTIHDVH